MDDTLAMQFSPAMSEVKDGSTQRELTHIFLLLSRAKSEMCKNDSKRGGGKSVAHGLVVETFRRTGVGYTLA